MPRSASPPSTTRRRSPSPRRERREQDRYADRKSGSDRDRRDGDRDGRGERHQDSHRDKERDRPRDYDRDRPSRPRSRSRSRSPPSRHAPRRPKELSFYKKSSAGMGSFSSRRDPLDQVEESEKERLQRRERGEVPARFGGTREQGVRNTMALPGSAPHGTAPSGMGSFRKNNDPLDRIPGKGGDDYRSAGGSGSSAPRGGGGGGAGTAGASGDKQREARLAAMDKPGAAPAAGGARAPRFIEVIANTRMGGKVRVKCLPTDTVGDLKKLIAAQTGTTAPKITLKKWYTTFKDHVSLQDYEINDGTSLEMY